jgi:preprotein translocase subunit SecF
MEFLKNPNFDFLGKAKYFIALSIVLLLGGVGFIAVRGLRYGVEFSGGTQVIVQFKTAPEIDKIRAAVTAVDPGAVIQTYGDSASHKVLIRTAGSGETAPAAPAPEASPASDATASRATEIDAAAKRVLAALAERYPENPVVEQSSEIVGPAVAADLKQKAITLTILGLVFQLVYIGIRFRGGIWGVAASLAALHDVLICIGFLAFFGYEMSLNVIAALLTLVGYSVNDTIVIFDRARENLRSRRKEPFAKILNDSLNQTLTRTLISNGTTFLTVLGLYLFGGDVLRPFGFAMVVGIVVGTYSTIYIATPLVVWWEQRKAGGGQAVKAKAAL